MQDINQYIEYTNLKQDAKESDIIKLCSDAKEHKFYGVCVHPCFIQLAKQQLQKTNIKIVSVIGFPLGMNTTETKIFEAATACNLGVDEIDVVINISKLLSHNLDYCLKEINSIKKAIGNKTLKVIVETCLLDQKTKEFAANLILKSDADFIKTSTGFNKSGANLEDVILFKNILGSKKGIKAAGGIKTKEQAISFIKKGAIRIGTSTCL